MDDRAFRNAMGKFATGVTVITTVLGDEIHGMTANAFMSVSMDPKLITVSVDERAHMHEKIQKAAHFAVSVLGEEQTETSMHFAGQKKQQNVEFAWLHGMPVIKDALANIVCELYNSYKVGDHTLYIGKVTDIETRQGDPLVFYQGKYMKSQADQSGIA